MIRFEAGGRAHVVAGPSATVCLLIGSFKFKFDYLNTNLTIFYCLRSKNFKNKS
jgi:hypothetical protein